MAIKVTTNASPTTTVRVGATNAKKVATSFQGSGSSGGLSGLSDVDVTNLANGSVIVYDSSTQLWVATNTLTPGSTKNLDINGGSF